MLTFSPSTNISLAFYLQQRDTSREQLLGPEGQEHMWQEKSTSQDF
jgi:hypothetical protein